MKLDKQIFHNFFYQRDDYERGKSATMYSGHHFFSYSTEVGMLYTEGEGRPVCFIADSNFSNTTAAHISALRAACPFDIIRVPFDYEDDFRYRADAVTTLKARFIKSLQAYHPENFTRKPARDNYNCTLYNFRAFLEATGQSIPLRDRRILESLEEAAAETPESKARRAELIKKREEKARKAREKMARELDKILKKWNVCTLAEKARFAFHAGTAPEISKQLRALLRKEFPGYSFIWIGGDNIQTSQGVTVSRETSRKAYQLFTAGKLTEGMHLGPYTVREITPDFVQIGCHKIAMQNIADIAAEM